MAPTSRNLAMPRPEDPDRRWLFELVLRGAVTHLVIPDPGGPMDGAALCHGQDQWIDAAFGGRAGVKKIYGTVWELQPHALPALLELWRLRYGATELDALAASRLRDELRAEARR